MRTGSSGVVLGVVLSLILGFGVFAAAVVGIRAITGLGDQSASVVYATKTGPGTATLELSAYPDSMVCHPNADDQQSQWVSYCSSSNQPATNLQVPPNSTITVIIKQYDSASTLINDYFRQVHGTLDGTMTVNGKSMTEINADQPGHTFTLQSTPDSSYPIFVSVPLLGVSSDAASAVTINGNQYPKPNIISFQFRTSGPDSYVWHCYVPCGSDRGQPYGFSGAMSTSGFMAGTLKVADY